MMMDSGLILLEYSGKIDYETHETLIEKAKNLIELTDIDNVIRKRLIYIIIEGLENIYKHSEHKSISDKSGSIIDDTFVLSSSDENYVIKIGNGISSDKVELLQHKIDYINSLNPESLKQYYNQVITNGIVTDKSGAGLGIIRMALKSNNQINYKISKINTEHFYFNMWVELPKKLNQK